MDTPIEIVTAFNDRINAGDLNALVALMTDDHRFIDPAAMRVDGKAACTEAWRGFFAAFPDYRNHFESLRGQGEIVIVTGRSTCSDPRLDGPALWRAVTSGGHIAEWRVYADTVETRRALSLA